MKPGRIDQDIAATHRRAQRFGAVSRLLAVAILAAATMGVLPQAARANYGSTQLRVLTSFPQSFYEPFELAFERSNPGIDLVVVQRNTANGMRLILERPDFDADMFWASAPDAFEVLKAKGQLSRTTARNTGAPELVSGYPVNDPDHYYLGFALSGYGFVYNPAYLAAHNLPVPTTWADLTKPVYDGHIGISSPSRSGTTHLIVEIILQTYGWDDGWALLSRLGGNLSTVTARSFGVPSGVVQRRFGVGITIDFLAQPTERPDAVRFVLPHNTVFVPASIAILARSRNDAAAERFLDFVLSLEGQSLLLTRGIDRIPVVPGLRDAAAEPARPFDFPGLMNGKTFDASLSASRYNMVNLLFDEFIVRKRPVLASLWRRVNIISSAAPSPQAQERIDEAVRELVGPPLAEARAVDRSGALSIDDMPAGLPGSEALQDFTHELRSSIEVRLRRAGEILDALAPPQDERGLLR
ncbi:ABC transporter substrate-binding protein [Mesorhizobium marinum]|uniref:ABC transporter substrate-binding protein n=1 Tax=Mesorhizobium marinum TaxID=3228790 RepID=UPI00346766AB